MNRRILIAASGVVAVAAVAWGAWAMLSGNRVQAGVGAFAAEVQLCQARIFEDMMHVPETEFVAGTEWHQGTAADLKVGGRFRTLNELGRMAPFDYRCSVRDRRVVNTAID